jgi:signal transduction histidine kinase
MQRKQPGERITRFNRPVILMGVSIGLILIGLIVYFARSQAYDRARDQAGRLHQQAAALNQALSMELTAARASIASGSEADRSARADAHNAVVSALNALGPALASDADRAKFSTLQSLHTRLDEVAAQAEILGASNPGAQAASNFDEQAGLIAAQIIHSSGMLMSSLEKETILASRDYSSATTLGIVVLLLFILIANAAAGVMVVRPSPAVRAVPPVVSPHVEFMDRLAHDMNSVLASILGYANLLADSDENAQRSDPQAFGKIILRQTLRLEKLITDGKLAVRISEGRLDLVRMPIRISPLLASLVDELSEQNERTIRFENQVETAQVMVDSLRLREALLRVIDNALHFSKKETPVILRLGPASPPGMVEIQVRDQGIGIAPEDLAALFKPFGRVRSEQARPMQGSGLGLFIARSIIEAHHGTFQLDSQPGQGTCAVIRLPQSEVSS